MLSLKPRFDRLEARFRDPRHEPISEVHHQWPSSKSFASSKRCLRYSINSGAGQLGLARTFAPRIEYDAHRVLLQFLLRARATGGSASGTRNHAGTREAVALVFALLTSTERTVIV